MSVELKPCPHCGSDAAFRIESSELLGGDHPLAGMEYIDCTNKRCGASTIAMYSTGEDCKPLLAERWNRRLDAAIKAAQQPEPMSDAQPDGWVSVKDRLPEVSRYVNAYVSGIECIFTLCLTPDGKWEHPFGKFKQPGVTHWMPLPAAPKEAR